MKYIIREDKLEKVFSDYMDYMYDLDYSEGSYEFYTKDDDPFGFIAKQSFYFESGPIEYGLHQMFGKNLKKLLLNYLHNKFPQLVIRDIKYFDYPSN